MEATTDPAAPPAVAVSARDVTRRYGEGESAVDALRGVSLEVPRGQFTAVMGPSGSGKSTLMHILAGLDLPSAGRVEIDGRDITTMDDKELTLLRRRHIGFVFQFFNLLPMLSAEENVVLPLSIAGVKPEPERLERVLEQVGVADRRTHRPSELSGGQQQRVAIARALITEPDRPLRGRADRQPRFAHRRRDPGAAAGGSRRLRPDDDDGHPRPGGGGERRPGAVPRRRARRVRPRQPERRADHHGHEGDEPPLTRFALKGLAGRRLRSTLTALAIVLGVAMISGAYTLTDTMGNAADTLAKASYSETEAVVTARTAFTANSDNGFPARPTLPESVLADVRAVPEVEVAVGDLTDEARIVGKDGKVAGQGPYFGVGYDAKVQGAQRLSPFRLQEGRFATGPGEVVIDEGTSTNEGYDVGDTVRIVTRGPAQPFRVTGVATFGEVKSIGTATFAIFDVREAQALFKKVGRYDDILVGGRPGVSKTEVRAALTRVLPASYAVQSAEKQDRFTLDGLKEFIGFMKTFLVVFGGIAVFVGAFTIFNTLSITVAQRSREFAMLRTIGATRRQILRAVLLEALVLGTLASVVGLFAGLGLAQLLSTVLASFGLDLPQTGLVFATRTIVVALLVGVIVTLLAGLGPALRATRVSPVTVLREGADVPPGRVGRRAPQIAIALTLLAVVLLGFGLFADVDDTTRFAALLGPGVLVLFVGVALMSPRFVAPLASVLGRPAQRFGGAAGRLARRNAERNPGRTAITAAALMIGIALVTFVTVLGAGLRESTSGSLKKEIGSDYVLVGSDGYSPIAPEAAVAANQVTGVTVSTGVTQDEARMFGKKHSIDGVDPERFADVFHQEYAQGSDADLRGLGADGAIVVKQFAEDHSLSPGDRFVALSASRKRLDLVVRAVAEPPKFNPLGLGDVTVADSTFRTAFETKRQRYAFVKANGGATEANTQALKAAMKAFPDVKLQTKDKFQKDQAAFVDQLLQILYVLLALAVIVSLFGIVNTLVLSVFERTRELGMLRAVGMSRRQVRRMIRWESIITALIGAVLGLVVGVFLAALVTTALADEGLEFALPLGSLLAFMIVAAVAGVLAAIAPARRAARLNVLNALQYE